MISDERWQDKDAVLREIGSPVLLTPIKETLAVLHESLEARFKAVNQRIDDGLNKHIKVTGAADKRRWTLIYPSEEEPVNNPISRIEITPRNNSMALKTNKISNSTLSNPQTCLITEN